MQLGSSQRGFVVFAAVGAAVAAGAGPSHSAGRRAVESSVTSSPFAEWGPKSDAIFREGHRRSDYAAELHYDLGLYFFERGNYELSLKHYRHALEIDPSFPEAYFGIGLLFYTLGEDEKAIRYYERVLDHAPRDADTWNNLGLIHYRRGELDRARMELEQAIRLQPRFPDAFYNLGLVAYQQNNLEEAVQRFLTALRQDPAYVRARFNLGVVYYELGMFNLARDQWRRVRAAAPETPLAVEAEQNIAVLPEPKGD